MRALHAAVPLLLVGGLVLSACGDGGNEATTSRSTAPVAEPSPSGDAGADPSAASAGALSVSECRALAQFPPEVQVPADLSAKPDVTVPPSPAEQLQTVDLVAGSGQPVEAGDCVVVNYVGVGQGSAEEFDASFDRGQPFVFPLGAGAVIEGWDQGLVGAPVGTRRELIIPSDLGYGATGTSTIPPGETLVFVVDVLGVAQPDGSVEQE